MKLRSLFAGLVCAALVSGAVAQPLAWDDPAIRDGACTPRPVGIPFPAALATTLGSLPSGFRLYTPLGNASYFRWAYQKVNGGVAATDQSQILATKPRVWFPFLPALYVGAIGRVDVERPAANGSGWYHLRVVGVNNIFATDVTVNIVSPNPGSAPDGYGGWDVSTVNIWADLTALVEWHCFTSSAGSFPIFNILSVFPTLTNQQRSSITAVLQNYGFQPSNFITIPY